MIKPTSTNYRNAYLQVLTIWFNIFTVSDGSLISDQHKQADCIEKAWSMVATASNPCAVHWRRISWRGSSKAKLHSVFSSLVSCNDWRLRPKQKPRKVSESLSFPEDHQRRCFLSPVVESDRRRRWVNWYSRSYPPPLFAVRTLSRVIKINHFSETLAMYKNWKTEGVKSIAMGCTLLIMLIGDVRMHCIVCCIMYSSDEFCFDISKLVSSTRSIIIDQQAIWLSNCRLSSFRGNILWMKERRKSTSFNLD